MRSSLGLILLAACGGGGSADPRLIAGGGIGDGEIDGDVHVYVVDSKTDAPLAGAAVTIDGTMVTTDATGLADFKDLSGPQTVAATLDGYRAGAWIAVNGTNVTIPLQSQSQAAPPQATLAGSIDGWSAINVAQGHVKAAFVLYSQSDDLGDDANNLPTPNNGNICFGANDCSWTVVTRTGAIHLVAIIIDRDTKGTIDGADDTNAIIGYASREVTVEAGVNQTGLALTQIEAGNLQDVTLDLGAPPAALTESLSIAGIEVGADEVIQLPLFALAEASSYLMPKATAFGASATYRLTAIAQTTSGDQGAQSIILRQGLAGPALAAGTWLTPPVNVAATRTGATWSPVTDAAAHSIEWRDAANTRLLEITVFDPSLGAADVPAPLTLPVSGALRVRVNAIGADFEPNDFSLKDDRKLLWGIAGQPTQVP